MCTVGKEKNNRAETGEARERGGEVQAEPASFDRDKEGEKKGDWRARRGYEKTQANAREKKWDLKKKMEPRGSHLVCRRGCSVLKLLSRRGRTKCGGNKSLLPLGSLLNTDTGHLVKQPEIVPCLRNDDG